MAIDFNRNEKIKSVVWIAIFGLLAVVGLGIFGLHQLLFAIAAPRPSVSTVGKIYVTREARRINKYSRESAQCGLIYEVDGKQYSPSSSCGGYGSGSDVSILYDPEKPSDAILDTRPRSYWFGIPGLFFGLVTYFLIRNFKRKLRAANGSPPLPVNETDKIGNS